MIFNELNLINQYYVVDPLNIVPNNLCPREEYADPRKIFKILYKAQKWDIIQIYDRWYYYIKIPWVKEYKSLKHSKIKSLYYYVLTDKPSLFKNLPKNNFKEWLNDNWSKTFLISALVFTHNYKFLTYNSNSNRYCIYLNGCIDGNDEVRTIIYNNSYTICNGLILLLSLHRINKIKEGHLFNDLSIWYQSFSRNGIYHIVDEQWEYIYYSNNISLIADLPYYYLCFGPNFSSKSIRSIFKTENYDELFSQYINGATISATNQNSIMYPYFNKDVMLEYNTYNEIMENDTYNIDISGYIQSIIVDDEVWNKWVYYKGYNINYILSSHNSIVKLLERVFRTCFYLYKFGSDNIKINKKKLRLLWNIFI